MNMKTVKIFLSSTFRDMNAERDVLIKQVVPRLNEGAERELGVRVREVDLRWGITEEQAKRGHVLELCLDGVEESKPYFVCMLGKRYGWMPSPEYIRKPEFHEILENIATEERKFLNACYTLASAEGRAYKLDVGTSSENKQRAQRILASAGLEQATKSITECEVDRVLSSKALPRFIRNFASSLNERTASATLLQEEKELLQAFYIREGGEPLWWLQPGASEDETDRLLGILDRLQLRPGYHSFFFIRQDAGEDHADYIETEKAVKDKLEALKTRVRHSDMPVAVRDYPCTWNGENAGREEAGLYPIGGLEEFGEIVFRLLWNHMQDNPELKREEEPTSELEEEQESHLRFVDSRTYNFTGRIALLEDLERKVDLALAGRLESEGKATRHVMVVGEPGAGKSALLARFYEQYQAKHADYLVIPHFIGVTPRSALAASLLDCLCQTVFRNGGLLEERDRRLAEIEEEFRAVSEEMKARDAEIREAAEKLRDEGEKRQMLSEKTKALNKEFDEKTEELEDRRHRIETEYQIPAVTELLKEKLVAFLGMTKKKAVIILDAANQIRKEESAREMIWMPEALPENACIVTSLVEREASDGHGEDASYDIEADTTAIEAMRRRASPPCEVKITRLSVFEQTEMITSYLAQYNKTLTTQQIQQVLGKEEAHNALYLQTAIEELRIVGRHEQLSALVESLPGTVVGIFSNLLSRVGNDMRRRFGDGPKDVFREFVTCIATGRNGMAEDDLRTLLGNWESPKDHAPEHIRLPDYHWGELRRSVRAYLFQRGDNWDFFHRQLKQAVGAMYLQHRETRCEAHRRIACYLEAMGYEHPTTLRDLPHHLVKAAGYGGEDIETWERVADVLSSLRFIQKKCAAGMVYELISDYATAIDEIPEGQESKDRERNRRDRMSEYLKQLAEVAAFWNASRCGADASASLNAVTAPSLPSIRSVELEDDGQDQEKIDASQGKASPPSKLNAFSQFVNAQSHLLAKHHDMTSFCTQQAHNFSPEGTVYEAANADLSSVHEPLALLSTTSRQSRGQRPAYLRVIEAHEGPISALGVAPNGCWIVSAGGLGPVTAGLTNSSLDTEGGLGSLLDLASSLDVSGSDLDGMLQLARPAARRETNRCSLRLWNVEDGRCWRTLECDLDQISAICISADSKQAIFTSKNPHGSLWTWNLETGASHPQSSASPQGDPSSAFHVTPDGRMGVVGYPGGIRVIDLKNGESLKQLEFSDAKAKVDAMSVTADGHKVVCLQGPILTVWHLDSGQCLTTIKGNAASGAPLSVTPDAGRGVWGMENGRIGVWDMAEERCLHIIEGHSEDVTSLDITHDGRLAVSGSMDGTIRIWNLTDGTAVLKLQGHSADVSMVRTTPDGRFVVSGSDDGRLRVWDLLSPNCRQRQPSAEAHTEPIRSISVPAESGGTSCVVQGDLIRLWNLDTEEECAESLTGHAQPILSADILPEGRYALSATRKEFRIWDVLNGKPLGTLDGRTNYPNRVVYGSGPLTVTADGHYALALASTGAHIWDLDMGEWILASNAKAQRIVRMAPDGRLVVIAGENVSAEGVCEILDLQKRHRLNTVRDMEGLRNAVYCVAVSPDGRSLVTGGGSPRSANPDFALQYWDLRTGSCLGSLEGHSAPVRNVRITPDSHFALSVSEDETFRMWDLRDRRCVGIVALNAPLSCLSRLTPRNKLAIGTYRGALLGLTLENLAFGHPFVTGTRLWRFGLREWDGRVTVLCPHCNRRSEAKESVLETVESILKTSNVEEGQSPILELSDEAWQESGLLSACQLCGGVLAFNPFVLDNLARAKYLNQ